ncbi:carbohydrate ABC transporter permease [Pseudarthrobacter sp. NamB4]|uniref:carbohydrate ABC transporter permease n=1 Tax=Pseudarthrobacter sp. NamB4 TaxID=2576837 RepID=UPI0010FE11CD|nr:carbohydrate ABC transporter permease [Pseudarthrobacter sp. NamB4]TLM70527.1 carbohydrate ABC transporter permease [Pseudarthrobacter sp. NamB4]
MSKQLGSAPRTAVMRWKSGVTHAALLLLAVGMLYPLAWMLVSSLRNNDEIFSNPSLIPVSITWSNYITGWTAQEFPFSRYFLNSFSITTASIVGNLFACSLTAFAFARLRFRFKPFWLAVLLGTIMLPEHVTIVPQYLIFSELGWLDTYLPLIVPKFFGVEAFFIFLMMQFMRSIPRELDEAAWIDGCGPIRMYWRIILPLTLPALTTTAIFTFIWTWNDFFRPLIFITSSDLFTVPMALRLFVDPTAGTNWGAVFAMSVLSLIPVFVFFLAGQRFLINGISTTGLK